MDKSQIFESLKSICPSVKLPKYMSFEIVKDCLNIKVSAKGVISNMQDDSSAFEGWTIVLKAAFPDVKTIILDWEEPLYSKNNKTAETAHYNRFLMRAANFKKAYAWFDVSSDHIDEIAEMQRLIDSKTIVVNYPKGPCSKVTDEKKEPEAALERKLVESWSKKCQITDEQLPVGLFKNGAVSIPNTFTPGRKSQIDLWQLDGDTMRIFELKAEGNEPIGIISELMFYVCTIKHIVDHRIIYPDVTRAKSYRHFKDFADAVAKGKINEVWGYFTAYDFHPLMKKDSIKSILNENSFNICFDFMNLHRY